MSRLKSNIRGTKVQFINKNRIAFTIPVFIGILLTSCDPGLNGDLKIFNQSDSTLTVVTFDYGHTDSTTFVLEPNTEKTIKIMSGLGNQKTFDCCPCELDTLYIKSSIGEIKKDPNNQDNWIIPNKSKQKKIGGEDLRCEFHVLQSDI